HSIHDPEPKYGMAVTGFADPDRIVRNSTMQPGDRLFLTKPLGLGIITTAVKRAEATAEQLSLAVETMTTLNAGASQAMLEAGAGAATDVTGFGFLGHLHIALRASGVSAVVEAAGPRLLPGTLDLAKRGVIPSGTRSNHEFVTPNTDWGVLSEAEQLILADAQTSGGLLIAIAEDRASSLRAALQERGIAPNEVGVVQAGEPGRLEIRGRIAPDPEA
ncbi:MAG: selenide, water dikinase SelD, partial [Actinomycetota bacterium]